MVQLSFCKPDLEFSKNVAIVGSSNILKKQKCATRIDSFDEVIRFNRAPTECFENIAGTKTTLRIVNGHVFQNVKFKRWAEDDDFVKKLRNMRIAVAAAEFDLAGSYKSTDDNNDVYQIAFNFVVKQIEQRFGLWSGIPTVGFVGIILCVYSDIKPHIYGWSGGKMSHYYNNRDPQGSQCHKFKQEWDAVQKLHKLGKIILH